MNKLGALKILPVPLITGKGYLILSIGIVILLTGITLQVPFVALAGTIGLFVFSFASYLFIDYVTQRRNLRDCLISAHIPSVIYSGVETALTLKVEMPSLRQLHLLELRPDIPAELSVAQETYTMALSPNQSEGEIHYLCTPLERGQKEWQGLYGRIRSGSGIVSWQFRYDFPEALTSSVYPNSFMRGDKSQMAFQKLRIGQNHINKLNGGGREFDSLKTYSPGDDLRKVDWKRSARGKGVLVKVFRPETHQRIHVALDCGRRMGNRLINRSQLEFAADAAAHLLTVASRNDDEVGFFAFHQDVTSKIPCGRGSKQVTRIIDALSETELSPFESDYQHITEWAQSNRKRSLLILITSVSNVAGMEQIKNSLLPVRSRHIPIVFCIADRDLIEVSEQPAANLKDAYIISAATEQLARIEHQRALLEKSGIDCIYCDATHLQHMLRKKYVDMKTSGRL